MRRERRLVVKRGGTAVEWSVRDWVGSIAVVLAVAFVVLLWNQMMLEATLVGSFGGGFGLSELVRIGHNRAARRGGRV